MIVVGLGDEDDSGEGLDRKTRKHGGDGGQTFSGHDGDDVQIFTGCIIGQIFLRHGGGRRHLHDGHWIVLVVFVGRGDDFGYFRLRRFTKVQLGGGAG